MRSTVRDRMLTVLESRREQRATQQAAARPRDSSLAAIAPRAKCRQRVGLLEKNVRTGVRTRAKRTTASPEDRAGTYVQTLQKPP